MYEYEWAGEAQTRDEEIRDYREFAKMESGLIETEESYADFVQRRQLELHREALKESLENLDKEEVTEKNKIQKRGLDLKSYYDEKLGKWVYNKQKTRRTYD